MSTRPQALLLLACTLLVAPSTASARAAPAPVAPPSPQEELLPDGALARLGTARWRPGRDVSALACSPDGRLVASGADCVVHLWEARTGKLVRALWGHREYVEFLAWSPDAKTLLSGSPDRTVRLWDVTTGREIHRLTLPASAVAVGFADKGKILVTASFDGAVVRWSAATGREIGRAQAAGQLGRVTLAREGDRMATLLREGRNSFLKFCVLDTETGKVLHELQPGSIGGAPPAFSPDGKTVALSDAGQIVFWDTATGQKVSAAKKVSAHKHAGFGGYGLAFTADGKAVAIEGDHCTILLREVATEKVLQSFKGHQHNVRALAFTSDGKRLLSGGAEMTIRVWDVATGTPLPAGPGPEGYLGSLGFSPDGKTLLSGAFDPEGRLWEASTGKELERFKGEPREVMLAVAFSRDGKRAAHAGGNGATIFVRDLPSGQRLHRLTNAPGRSIYSLVFSHDGHILYSAGFENVIRRWDLRTGRALEPLQLGAGYLRSLSLSADGKTLLSAGSDGVVRLWDAPAGKELRQLKGHAGLILSAALTPDGRTAASVGSDRTLRVWDAITGKQLRQWSTPFSYTIALSPDGRHLAAASWRVVRLWETATGRELRPLLGHRGHVSYVAFSHDGKRLASGGYDTTVLVWDAVRLLGKGPPPRAEVESDQWQKLWADLAAPPDYRAEEAAGVLQATAEQTVTRLREMFAPPPAEEKIMAKLIGGLGDDKPERRRMAVAELKQLGAAAEPALRKALARRPDPDFRLRIELLLSKLAEVRGERDTQRPGRTARLLESIDTPEAVRLLRHLAAWPAESPWSREAKDALRRLDERRQTKP